MANERCYDQDCEFECNENEFVGSGVQSEIVILWLTSLAWMWH